MTNLGRPLTCPFPPYVRATHLKYSWVLPLSMLSIIWCQRNLISPYIQHNHVPVRSLLHCKAEVVFKLARYGLH